jgi:hypothetical protein
MRAHQSPFKHTSGAGSDGPLHAADGREDKTSLQNEQPLSDVPDADAQANLPTPPHQSVARPEQDDILDIIYEDIIRVALRRRSKAQSRDDRAGNGP